ncbi:MAG: hypothetical protein ACREDE_09035, partial [Thermoplasmata archaeon]
FALVVGILLLVHVLRLFPASSLPYWVLFIGIGIIAYAGAALGAVAPDDPEEDEPVTPRRRTVRRPPPRSLELASVAGPTPSPEVPPENLSEPWREDGESASEPDPEVTAALNTLISTGAFGSSRADAAEETDVPSDAPEEETGEVLAQLEQLSTLMRPARTYVPSAGASSVVRYCIGCERRISPEEEPIRCPSCQGALCPECGTAAQHSSPGGRCPTCASLEEAQPSSSGGRDAI